MDMETLMPAQTGTRFEGTAKQMEISQRMLSHVCDRQVFSTLHHGDVLQVGISEKGAKIAHIQRETGTRRVLTQTKNANRDAMRSEIPFTVLETTKISCSAPVTGVPKLDMRAAYKVVILSQGKSRWCVAQCDKTGELLITELCEGHTRIEDDTFPRPVHVRYLDCMNTVKVVGNRVQSANIPYSLLAAVRSLPASLAA